MLIRAAAFILVRYFLHTYYTRYTHESQWKSDGFSPKGYSQRRLQFAEEVLNFHFLILRPSSYGPQAMNIEGPAGPALHRLDRGFSSLVLISGWGVASSHALNTMRPRRPADIFLLVFCICVCYNAFGTS